MTTPKPEAVLLNYTDLAPAGSSGSSDADLADELFRGFEQGVPCLDFISVLLDCAWDSAGRGFLRIPRQRVLDEWYGWHRLLRGSFARKVS